MATVLYITANPQDHEKSYSMLVGKEFVQTYRSANPNDEVIHLDLYQMDIPQLDKDIFSGWDKLKAGRAFAQLTEAERMKLSRMNELVDQFVDADKYVFVTPIWNYSYPPVMKSYIDSICIAGKTFKYLPDVGRVGLMSDKKAVHIQASGSFLSPGSDDDDLEMGHRHLKSIMEFIGVTSFSGIFVEGMAVKPDQEPVIKDKAIQQAREIAQRF
ncbi:FMN-dependent NADH-azoreductase 2 [Brevibacillus reuszeri]|uniref:FMN dependent NADH:quinone oxidoreductase n=1 Tax=Brevibacillus reuszeri TaxID=54915 RepID=A0A0K9YPT1_9BACL|nr:FMN-dependent NADH-azoreductase [Brevibacillus reuszeri]KNB70662.1 FMN-dependent NADH-azoreductase [Brevibacillus reuszeri]MED1861339.1 FMN-dependent NADH-azoreductase [Brevibacillus reuszeri]GED69880.1 FMN-dependent NADH-azoreductase 2 [Brevibacillus reuszeri]